MVENLILVAAGLIAGFLSGLTGIGTGLILLVVIPIVLGDYGVVEVNHVRIVIANTVFATLIASIANIITSIRQRAFYPRETMWVSLAAVVIAFLSFELIVKSQYYSRQLFNSVIIVYMFVIIFQIFKKLKLSNPRNEHVTRGRLLTTGGLAGTIASLTGLGGGTVIIPLLNLWQRVDIRKAKSISFGSIFSISLWLTVNNLFLEPATGIENSVGLIILPMIIPLSIGVLVGAPVGVLIGEKLSSRAITLLFLLATSIVAIHKIADLIRLY